MNNLLKKNVLKKDTRNIPIKEKKKSFEIFKNIFFS